MITIKNPLIRKIIEIAVPFVIIPLLVILGVFIPGEKQYIYISIAISLFTVVLFLAGFEKKKIGSRRLVLAAVFIALSVAGRFIPFFKPVTALVIIAAVYLGGETGFLIGVMSAVISNFYFGQGPWTPFQMLATGLIGLFAGLLGSRIKNNRIRLVIYGAFSGLIYSFIMDIWTVLWYNGSLEPSLYASAILTALPYTLMYAVSNVLFLWLLCKPLGDKLERVKKKYGI